MLCVLDDTFPNAQQQMGLAYLRSGAKTAGGLVINAASSPHPKTVNTVNFSLNGKLYAKAAATATLSALGNLLPGYATLIGIFVNAAGTFSFQKVSDVLNAVASTLRLPTSWDVGTVALIGALKIVNGTASNFVIGTTPLDTALVTCTYYDLGGMMPGELV